MGTQNFLFVPRSWQDEKTSFLILHRAQNLPSLLFLSDKVLSKWLSWGIEAKSLMKNKHGSTIKFLSSTIKFLSSTIKFLALRTNTVRHHYKYLEQQLCMCSSWLPKVFLELIACPPCLVAWKQRRDLKRDKYNIDLISSNIPTCSQKHEEELKNKIQQECHYRKPDIDGDVSSGRSYLEHFGRNVFNLSFHGFRRGHVCCGCFVADEARGRPKRTREDQKKHIRYAERDLEHSTGQFPLGYH